MQLNTLLEKNMLPDFLIRMGIRKLLKQRLNDENKGNDSAQQKQLLSLIDELKTSPIAINTKEANEQHYELPTEFYQYCLGKNLKYSCGYWKNGTTNIDISENNMLELTCERAELKNGQEVLELGCGWGSLSLFMAAKFSQSNFTVVSNSHTQKEYIDEQALLLKIKNLTVITCDINEFASTKKFDRIVSVEMFEHLRNYELLFKRLALLLNENGKLFAHIFTHKTYAYKFEVKDETDWMSKYFFTGGIMPSTNLFSYFNQDLVIVNQWLINGTHYSKTSEAWLERMTSNRNEIIPLFEKTYGKQAALKWWVYWRIFYMACSELFKYNDGNEWMVSHYLFTKK